MGKRAAIYTRGEQDETTQRAAIYTRVSKDMRDTGRSVEQQEAECRAWVDHEKTWKLAGVWCDNDRSASQYATKTRPDWEQLLDEIEAGNIDILVVWEPSRATRDRGVWATLAALCEENDVRVAASGRIYDLADADDAFQLDLFFSLAARESRVTSKRVKRDQASQAAKGRPHGRHLFGYRREYDPKTGVLLRQVHDDQPRVAFRRACVTEQTLIGFEFYTAADVVREIFRKFNKGVSLGAIVYDLNLRGVRPPRGNKHGWHPGVVHNMMLNLGYIGRRIHQGRDAGPADWAPLVDTRTFYTVQTKLTDPSRLTTREFAVVHLLSRILECGVCGAGLMATKNGNSPLYRCMTRKQVPGGKGNHVGRSRRRMDALVRELVIGRLSRPDAAEVFARDEEEAAELARILGSVAEKRARLAEHYELSAQGKISAMAVSAVEARLLPEIEAEEARARRVRMVPLLGELILPSVEEVTVAWDGLEVSQQREVIRALFSSIKVHPLGRGRKATHPLDGIEVNWR